MEGHPSLHREKSRPPYPRSASRSSASTRMTTQSANSSTSQMSSSPQLSNAHPAHRYYHASCSRSTASPRPASRSTPQLSREASSESARQQTPVSSFLQEKLQKERQAESQKNASVASRSNSDMSASFEMGSGVQKSPLKSVASDHRPPSSGSGGTDPQKKGLALKEMEQVVSGLHKQNFDLKLELYHRRERQTMLEERLEALEAEKTQVEEMNDKLLGEMEKRDKAVEEAVAMIIMLEANVAALKEERNMVRRVEAQGFYNSPEYKPAEKPSLRADTLDVSPLDYEAKNLNRMPSFVSDRSDRTENLRNVYLNARGSVLSLARVAEGADIDDGSLNRIASPALSLLSESSFVSVYGQKDQPVVTSRVNEPLSLDGIVSKPAPREFQAPPQRPESGRQTPRSNSFSRVNSAGHFQPTTNLVEGSPLQRIERMDSSYPQKRESSRPPSSGKALGSDMTGASRSPARRRTREEKREALRKVMTDGHGGVSLHEQTLPPTPDTVASSTLRRFKNSNDTLDRRHDSTQGRSQDSLPQWTNSHEKLPEAVTSPSLSAEPPVIPRTRNTQTVFPHHGQMPIQRPRSADESTISHRRDQTWDSDIESDGESMESSLDIWLRVGSKPQRGGRMSPDLFGFPTNPASGSWAMNAMFNGNTTQTGGARVYPDRDQMRDLASAQEALFGARGPPPPPHRRSSLNTKVVDDGVPKPPAQVQAAKPSSRRPRHARRNSDDAQMRVNMKTPAPGQLTQPPPQTANGEQKRGHYPPIAGQHGARNGLSRLWRRSIGASSNQSPEPVSAAVDPINERSKTVQPPAQSWVNRSSAFDDDRSGATPPPILRDTRPRAVSQAEPPVLDGTTDTPTAANKGLEVSVSGAQEQHDNNAATGTATGSRRKWLPTFARSGSLKK